jgi:hypothetical protein
MDYSELKQYFKMFYRGEITKLELAFAIGMWQRAGARIK